jgi:hypothetical protein
MTVSAPPAPPETSAADSEFDLDLNVQPVDRQVYAENARPTMCSCVECNSDAGTCTECPPN